RASDVRRVHARAPQGHRYDWWLRPQVLSLLRGFRLERAVEQGHADRIPAGVQGRAPRRTRGTQGSRAYLLVREKRFSLLSQARLAMALNEGPVVVTGAGGFIGRALIVHFRETKRPFRATVRAWDEKVALPDTVRVVRDLASAPDAELAALVEGAVAVVHL